jgi:hypothetical protein
MFAHDWRVESNDSTELSNACWGKAQFMRDVCEPHLRAEQPFCVWHNRNQTSTGLQRLPNCIEQVEQLRSCVVLEHAERANRRVSIRSSSEIVERRSTRYAREPPRSSRLYLAGAQVDTLDTRVADRSQRIEKSSGTTADIQNRRGQIAR